MLFRKFVTFFIIAFLFSSLSAEAIKIGLQTQAKELKIASSVSAEIYDLDKNVILYGREGKAIKAITPNQKRLVDSAEKNDMVFVVGPAGTGKTYTAVALAVRALKNKQMILESTFSMVTPG